ncbi:hypothetical protein ACX5HH_002840 [Providencia stuartii]|uniref:hypothetical protein n=1 Tax=Providencia stuartii TaxID=588 RepID=UPI000A7085AC
MVKNNTSTSLMVIFVGLLAALAGLFFGLDTGLSLVHFPLLVNSLISHQPSKNWLSAQ